MTRKKRNALGAFLILFAVAGCAAADESRNPLTGAPVRTFLMSQEQEAQIGRAEHPKVLAQFGGAYRDPEAQRFVERVGDTVKNVSELKDEKFTFTLLDSDVVNAFALPGGYVYVSRGLLALANNEAEVAGVLGHEVGHVTARHTAQRYDRAVAGQLGAGLAQLGGALLGAYLGGEQGARLGGQVGGQLGTLGAQAYVQGFSREQEFEADQLGIVYLGRAGYDPRAMSTFLQALQANDAFERRHAGREEGEAVPNWLRSHPRTPDRVARAAEATTADMPAARRIDRQDFLAAIDGMIFGENPEQGFVRGRSFQHPALRIAFEAPPGFKLKNSPSAVVGADGQGRVMQFDLAQNVQSRDLRGYLQNEWVKRQELQDLQRVDLDGQEAAIGFGRVSLNDRPATAMFAALRGTDGRVYRFLFARTGDLGQGDVAAFEQSLRSFRRLSAAEAAELKPLRIELVTVREGDTIDSLSRRMQVEDDPRGYFVLLNGLDRGRELRPGDQVKILRRG